MPGKYDDIIDLPHHTSENRQHITMEMRAAQFSPFAALTGLDDELAETARLTSTFHELSEDEKQELDRKLQELRKGRSMTQEELAEALFVSRTAVSKWESGRGYPGIDSLKAISRFFSVSIDELICPEGMLSVDCRVVAIVLAYKL